MNRILLPLLLLLIGSTVNAQWFDWQQQGIPRTADGSVDLAATAPRTFDGKPNISGMWVPGDASGSLFDLDNYQDWALEVMREQERTFFVNDPRFHCLPDGPASYPAGPSVGGSRQIVQTPSFIAVLNGDMTYRQIHLDGYLLWRVPYFHPGLGFLQPIGKATHWSSKPAASMTKPG